MSKKVSELAVKSSEAAGKFDLYCPKKQGKIGNPTPEDKSTCDYCLGKATEAFRSAEEMSGLYKEDFSPNKTYLNTEETIEKILEKRTLLFNGCAACYINTFSVPEKDKNQTEKDKPSEEQKDKKPEENKQ